MVGATCPHSRSEGASSCGRRCLVGDQNRCAVAGTNPCRDSTGGSHAEGNFLPAPSLPRAFWSPGKRCLLGPRSWNVCCAQSSSAANQRSSRLELPKRVEAQLACRLCHATQRRTFLQRALDNRRRQPVAVPIPAWQEVRDYRDHPTSSPTPRLDSTRHCRESPSHRVTEQPSGTTSAMGSRIGPGAFIPCPSTQRTHRPPAWAYHWVRRRTPTATGEVCRFLRRLQDKGTDGGPASDGSRCPALAAARLDSPAQRSNHGSIALRTL